MYERCVLETIWPVRDLFGSQVGTTTKPSVSIQSWCDDRGWYGKTATKFVDRPSDARHDGARSGPLRCTLSLTTT